MRKIIQTMIKEIPKMITRSGSFEQYAQLCRRLMTSTPGILQSRPVPLSATPAVGGQVFKTYLITSCQESFQRHWSLKESLAETLKKEVGDIQNEATGKAWGENWDTAPASVWEEADWIWHSVFLANEQWLRVVRFISDLFKAQLLNVPLMHTCISTILSKSTAGEEDAKALRALLLDAGPGRWWRKRKEIPTLRVYVQGIRSTIDTLEEESPARPFLLVSTFSTNALGCRRSHLATSIKDIFHDMQWIISRNPRAPSFGLMEELNEPGIDQHQTQEAPHFSQEELHSEPPLIHSHKYVALVLIKNV